MDMWSIYQHLIFRSGIEFLHRMAAPTTWAQRNGSQASQTAGQPLPNGSYIVGLLRQEKETTYSHEIIFIFNS